MANSKLSSRFACIAFGAALVASFARGQVSVSRAVFGAGGGAASGGVYSITDTLGESPVGDASASPDAITGGFWGTFGSVPEVSSLSLIVRSNASLTIPTSSLLAADYADGEALSVVSVDAASAGGGAVALITGGILYKAPTNFTGVDSFHYTVSDDEGDAATALVSVTVVASTITVTSAADSGPGTLRAAVAALNTVSGPNIPGVIKFSPTLTGQTIQLSTVADSSFGPSALVVSNNQTIDGSDAPGLVVAAASSAAPMRLLFVPAGSLVTVENLTLTNGEALGGAGAAGGGGGGGAAGFGGGILNEGSITLSNVTLAGNQAVGGPGGAGEAGPPGASGAPTYGGFGAGAAGSGTCGGDGGLGAGGAIFNYAGVAEITNCVLRGNTAIAGGGGAGLGGVCDGVSGGPSLGGAIFNYNGYIYLTGSSFSNNSSSSGAGLCNYGDAAASWVYLTGNTLADTAATNDFASLSANGGDAQTVESTNTIDSQDALWFSPAPDVGTFQTNHPLTVPLTLNIPTNVSGSFVLQAVSSDQTLAGPGDLVFSGGAGGQYMLTITPAANQLGTALITVFTEGAGLSAQTSFMANFGLFLTITITPGGRLLSVTADPGLACTIQYKASLSNAAWTTLGNMTQISPGHYQILDSSAQGAERFYRAVIP